MPNKFWPLHRAIVHFKRVVLRLLRIVLTQMEARCRPDSRWHRSTFSRLFLFLACNPKILRATGCRTSVRPVAYWPHKLLLACDYQIRVLFLFTELAHLKNAADAPSTTSTNKEAKGNSLAANGKRLWQCFGWNLWHLLRFFVGVWAENPNCRSLGRRQADRKKQPIEFRHEK